MNCHCRMIFEVWNGVAYEDGLAVPDDEASCEVEEEVYLVLNDRPFVLDQFRYHGRTYQVYKILRVLFDERSDFDSEWDVRLFRLGEDDS